MKTTTLISAAFLGTALTAAPFCHWDFEKGDAAKQIVENIL